MNNKIKLKILDIYIIKKFLGTFFFSILLIICIAVIFDFSEKIDDFLEHEAPLRAIIFDYYFNFIPYFAVLFSSLFTFIAVIFFTSKMAYNSEIIAILSSGVSLRRLLVPYFISATIITALSLYLNNYVIPKANEERFIFEEMYYHNNPVRMTDRDIHKQIETGVYIYMESYSNRLDMGRRFSMEKFDNNKLVSKLMADYIKWDSTTQKWNINNYYVRNFNNSEETIVTGKKADTTLNMTPEEFKRRDNFVETMDFKELNDFIAKAKLQGIDHIEQFLIEKHTRLAFPFSTYILTLLGLTVSSRKVRGGIGMHLGYGLLLSFAYILFMQFSSQFAIGGKIDPMIAAWIPNFIFAFISFILYKKAQK